jgi:hypothetical protein
VAARAGGDGWAAVVAGNLTRVRIDKRLAWRLFGTLTGLAAGAAARSVLRKGWVKSRGSDPPTNPAAPGVTWGDALGWTLASAVALGVARLVAQRGAAEAWRAATGSYPDDIEDVSP